MDYDPLNEIRNEPIQIFKKCIVLDERWNMEFQRTSQRTLNKLQRLKKKTPQWEKPDRSTFIKGSLSTPSIKGEPETVYHSRGCDGKTATFLPKTQNVNLMMRRRSTTRMEGHATKQQACNLQESRSRNAKTEEDLLQSKTIKNAQLGLDLRRGCKCSDGSPSMF